MTLASGLLLVVAALVIVINGEEVETPAGVRDESTLAASTSERQRVDKDGNNGDHRQGRTAAQAEAPSSKAKREQALRNILAARRRQLLGSRIAEAPKTSTRNLRPVSALSKDPVDMLEAQETRHGVYVTAPIGDEIAVVVAGDDEESIKFASPDESTVPSALNDAERSTKNSPSIRTNVTDLSLSAASKSNDTPKNGSMARFQKTLEPEIRRKNIVAMPDSLYNHFRPVESNIPVEDMTQFLYFGQKLHPESQNITGNSSDSTLDATSTLSSLPSSRRRYSMKRFSTTTPIPMPRLEEMINEEMNIALESSTIERNKIPKTKSIFRAPGSGVYFRKAPTRSADTTIVSNVILTRESSRNANASSEDKREIVSLRNSGKFHSDPSAHARQVVIVADEGSSAESVAETASAAVTAHRAGNATTGNAADSTQLHKDTESMANKEKRHQRKDHSYTDPKRHNSTAKSIPIDTLATTKPTTSRYEKIDDKSNKITTWQTVQSNDETTTSATYIDFDEVSRIASSTINDLAGTLEPKSSSIIPTAAGPSHAGSLRIVVTEPMINDSAIESVREDEEEEVESLEDAARETDEDTVNRADSPLTGNPSSPSSIRANVSSSTDASVESTLGSSIADKRLNAPASEAVKTETKQQHAYAYEITNVTRLLRNYTGPGLNAVAEDTVKENGRKKESAEVVDENERTNRTSGGKKVKKIVEKEEQTVVRGAEEEEVASALRRTNVGGIEKIRNVGGSGEPTPQRQPLPLLLPTLLRSSGSGGIVEPARTPGELSAGTDVGEATASSTSNFNTSTGGTPTVTSAGSGSSNSISASNSGASGTSGSSSSNSSSSSSSQTPSSSSASSSSSHLVGERGRKGAVGARQQYHQQNQNRGSGGIGIGSRNTSPSSSATVTTTEVSGASTAGVDRQTIPLSIKDRKSLDEVTENIVSTSTRRWNHTGINKIAGTGADRSETFVNDRRYLRKSVSAVLNQRTIEDGLVKELKRRRQSVSSLFSQTSVNNRRIKNSKISANEESRISASRSMENRTVTESSEIATSASRTSVDIVEDVTKQSFDKFEKSSDAMTDKGVESTVRSVESANRTDLSAATMEKVPEDAEGTTVATLTTLDSPATRSTEGPYGQTENVQTSAKSVEAPVTDGSASSASERTDRTSENLSIGAQTTATLRTVATAKSLDTTTPAGPAFPVTPRMLKDPSESVDNEGTVGVNAEIGNETKSDKTQEISRPFGLAKDLDPSEIQKMYRSQTTLKPDATTITPEIETDYPVTSLPTKESSRTTNPANSSTTRKTPGNERSPEVRGRNLSDNSEDKDDVLPIMQLYNTTDIFNGTGMDAEDDASTTLRTPVLPGAIEVNATRQEISGESAQSTTLEPETSESLAKERKGEERQTGQRNQDDHSPPGITKKNRHGGREDTNETSGSSRSSNHSNSSNPYNPGGAHANRTRYRPTYYHPTTPEFVGYRPEFNGSFYEPGMISVSPRESVNISEVITKRHDGDAIATQETVAVVAYILATLVVFPIAVGVGLILRRLIIRNRKVLEESDTSSEISCRKDALNLENGDFKTSIEKAITKLPRIQHLCHEAEKPPPPPSQESRWEFPRDKLRLQTVLGQGNFGQVWKAEADDLTGHQGTTRLVAVKTVKEGASAREKEDLVRELEIMQQLGNHPNVVTLLGCCTDEEPHYLILEYVMYGKLLAYLRDHRTRQDFYNFSEDSAALTSRDLTVFGYCVARGMEYLASKKIIHRDLAARNVLVDHNKLCKIADFGMSRFANEDGEVIEARHGRNALPIRWMAPESLIYSLFTTKTDVWSFGILMWEIVTLGSTPYPDMAAREVMRNVQNGYRLERPSHCRSELFRVIARCWQADPDRRPEFQTLRRDMAQLLEDSMNGHYVDLESFASECTD